MRFLPASCCLGLVVSIAVPKTASAHIKVVEPLARHEQQKTGPCGKADDMRGDLIHTFAPGQTITIVWDEFVPHPGHYRISFDNDGEDDFVDPADYDDFYTNDTVLLDNIPDNEGTGTYMQEVTLPNIPCDNCTLQVVQMMTDKPPYGDGNDLYYQCIDIVLTGDDPTDSDTDDPTSESDSESDSETDSESDSETDDPTTDSDTEASTSSDTDSEGSTTEEPTTDGVESSNETDETTIEDSLTETSGVNTDSETDTSIGSGDDEGCGCRVDQNNVPVGVGFLVAAGLLGLRRRRAR